MTDQGAPTKQRDTGAEVLLLLRFARKVKVWATQDRDFCALCDRYIQDGHQHSQNCPLMMLSDEYPTL